MESQFFVRSGIMCCIRGGHKPLTYYELVSDYASIVTGLQVHATTPGQKEEMAGLQKCTLFP